LVERLSADLTARLGRGFGVNNLKSMWRFFLAYPQPKISQTVSGKFDLSELAKILTMITWVRKLRIQQWARSPHLARWLARPCLPERANS